MPVGRTTQGLRDPPVERSPFSGVIEQTLFNDHPTLQITMNALADGPEDFKAQWHGFGLQLL
ncbi:hypothetical protein OG739_31305 [Streptomyces longwoodensis]|uniref:hypothetical protein n=1 Tax=Streptomyces longwoodensis TaxID=68231 RepID=UPI00324E4A4C